MERDENLNWPLEGRLWRPFSDLSGLAGVSCTAQTDNKWLMVRLEETMKKCWIKYVYLKFIILWNFIQTNHGINSLLITFSQLQHSWRSKSQSTKMITFTLLSQTYRLMQLNDLAVSVTSNGWHAIWPYRANTTRIGWRLAVITLITLSTFNGVPFCWQHTRDYAGVGLRVGILLDHGCWRGSIQYGRHTRWKVCYGNWTLRAYRGAIWLGPEQKRTTNNNNTKLTEKFNIENKKLTETFSKYEIPRGSKPSVGWLVLLRSSCKQKCTVCYQKILS